MQFNEHQLELSIMELFENEGYTHQTGNDIHREKTDVLRGSLLKTYLCHRYAKEDWIRIFGYFEKYKEVIMESESLLREENTEERFLDKFLKIVHLLSL